jgi:small subunit ribosomal protein S16
MSVKIRLQRRGRKKLPLYHIVIADSRSPRDGRFIENIGSYNPLTKPAQIEIDRDKAFDWLMKGAEPTDTVRAILKFKGVMYRKHLNRGVSKGAMTQEAADTKYQAWIEEKESKIASRRQETRDAKSEFHTKRSGSAKPKKAEASEVVAEETAPVAEETPPVAQAPEPVTQETVPEEVAAEQPTTETPEPNAESTEASSTE